MSFFQRASVFAFSALFLMACGKEGQQAPVETLPPEAPPMQPQQQDPYGNGGQFGQSGPQSGMGGMPMGMSGPGGMQQQGMPPMGGPGGMQQQGMPPMGGPGGMHQHGMPPPMNGPGPQGGPGMGGPAMPPPMNGPGPQGGPGMGGPYGMQHGMPPMQSAQYREAYEFFSNVQVSQQTTVRPLFNGQRAVRIATQVVSQRGFRMEVFRAHYNRCIQNGMTQVQAIQQAFYEMKVQVNVQEFII